LTEFAAFYPHAIKKNKNASPGIDSMWKDMKQQKYDIEDTNRYLSLKNNAIRGESNKK